MRGIFLVCALLWLPACGDTQAPPAEPAEPAPAPEPVAEPPAPAPAPPAVDVPEGNLRGDAVAGAASYQLYCTTCHGAEGKGDGPASAALDPKPADHSDPVRMGALSDEEIFRTISGGGASVGKSPLMTAWGGVLSEDQIRDVLAHIRSLSGT